MIIELDVNDTAKLEEIKAAEPCHVWFDLNRIVVYTGADIPKTEVAPRSISPFEFLGRFTEEELAACSALAYSGAGDVNVASLLVKLSTVPTVDLDSTTVANGLGYLAAKGVIAKTRKNEILK